MERTETELIYLESYKHVDFTEVIQPDCQLLHEYWLDINQLKGPLLEIGPGPGHVVAYALARGKRVQVVDKDPDVLNILKTNLERAGISDEGLNPVCQNVLNLELKQADFACISISNVLHFLDKVEAQKVVDSLLKALLPGGLIFLRVHAENHPGKDQALPEVKFFALSEFEHLWQSGRVELVYSASVASTDSLRSRRGLAEAYYRLTENYLVVDNPEREAHLELLLRKPLPQ